MLHRLLILGFVMTSVTARAEEIPNALIDYDAFASNVAIVGPLRESRRISEADFIRMARDPSTVILDARSAEKFGLLHVKGARNLSLPDITAQELAKIIPTPDTRILIYCNNNFVSEAVAFPSKTVSASLNVYTFNVLYSYGYRNVYELGPLLDIRTARIEFEGTRRMAANR